MGHNMFRNVVVCFVLTFLSAGLSRAPGQGFINEIDYDESGSETNEFIELVAPAGTDATGCDRMAAHALQWFRGERGVVHLRTGHLYRSR